MIFKTLLFLLLTQVQIPTSQRSEAAIQNTTPRLKASFQQKQLNWGSPVYIRIFKANKELQVWIKSKQGFVLFKSYPVCTYSGQLGPKLKEGDFQSPEGFYYVKPNQLNPWSRFHLSFNLGFPNAYDRAQGRTGSALMVHGSCVSIGCYAMTDAQIEEIYTLMDAAYQAGQPFIRVHIFPFEMNQANMSAHKNSPWIDFWTHLKIGHDFFADNNRPPNVEVVDGMYVFD